MLKKTLNILLITTLPLLLFACDSKINKINIHGTYKGSTGISSYEAVVDAGTITIYTSDFFEKSVYWYGTCYANELNSENKLISKRIDSGNQNRSWFSFGFGESRVSEREILFTENSLTFVYDMNGMAINQVTLYKEGATKKYNEFDSNAEKEDPNYVEPSKPLPHEIPRGTTPSTERPTEAPTENPNIEIPEGNNYSL